jgi:dihydrofolate reductase/catechol 2,3-dioxygenase-like lactoylglutathione lyase family enzyme
MRRGRKHGGDDISHVRRFDHVGITVADLNAATEFFVALGMEIEGRTFVEGEFIDTVIGIPGSRTEIVMLRPLGNGTGVELSSFIRPSCVPGSPTAMANEVGLRSVAFEVHDLDAAVHQVTSAGYALVGGVAEYEGTWRMAYVRGPEGIIVALAQPIGSKTRDARPVGRNGRRARMTVRRSQKASIRAGSRHAGRVRTREENALRKLSVVEFITLDGVMQGLGGPDEDREGGFEHGGWSGPYGDEVAQRAAGGIGQTSVYLFGRKTYERMAAHWPKESARNPIAASLNAVPKYVATKTLRQRDLHWANSHVLDGDIVDAVQGLKAQGDGSVTVLGSGAFVQTLIANELIDTFRIMLHPLVLGTGKRLFREYPRPVHLRLAECTPTTTGVLILTYERET